MTATMLRQTRSIGKVLRTAAVSGAAWRPLPRVLTVLAALGGIGGVGIVHSAEAVSPTRFLRIATGPAEGVYFLVGGAVANAVSNPPGSRSCEKGGNCGVPGLIAVAQTTRGSDAGLHALAAGQVDMALLQADTAAWAFSASGPYAGRKKLSNLRGLARLYDEAVHLVVRPNAGIKKVADLKGKRVCLGVQGSGTRIDAALILEAFGLGKQDVQATTLDPGAAADALAAGKIDAYFFVGGTPLTFATPALANGSAVLVPIDGPPAKRLIARNPFYREGEIPPGAYPTAKSVKTLYVPALLATRADLPDDLVAEIMTALWHPSNQALLHQGHPAMADFRLELATRGMTIPLHPAALAYYKEKGMPVQ